MPEPKFTFLFAPIDAVGHFNACIGIAGQLRDRGHNVVFATPVNGWKGKLKAKGFGEELYSHTAGVEIDGPELEPDKQRDKFGQMIAQMAPALAMSPEDQIQYLQPALYQEVANQIKHSEARMREIVKKVNPDVIVVDSVMECPALTESGIPWVLSVSCNPLIVSAPETPRGFTGLAMDADKSEWDALAKRQRESQDGVYQDFNEWIKNNGCPGGVKFDFPLFLKHSPYANIYQYPIELDYTAYRSMPPKWYRFDGFVRETNETFEIPEKLANLPGKLIYFSMGTIGCAELGLMSRILGILSKAPHRFIVSKGPLADKFDLPDNMWGEAMVPQTKVLPLVDLVITHGGNNTITEAFYFGRRILVLPLFCDQFDNGQRIHELGLGLRFFPYKVSEEELLAGIETILKDDALERKMKSISERIQSSKGQSGAADIVENIARQYKGQV